MGLGRIVWRYSSLLHSVAVGRRGFSRSAVRMEEALEKLQQNPYYEKYADRIARLQQTDPEEFLQRATRKAEAARPTVAVKSSDTIGQIDTRQYSSVLNPKGALPEGVAPEEKKLDAIFKTELVQDKNADEIKNIWVEYHRNKDVISATIPVDVYSVMQERMKRFPTFLFPLPRVQGYEFIVCQSLGHTVHFTPLLAFQVHKENAPECLTMVHYTELSEKEIILMRGEYDQNVVSAQEAQCLGNQFQLYYSSDDAARLSLLQCFTETPQSFKHMDLIGQLENITIA